MARGSFRRILSATSGLNNTLDPTRLAFDAKTGVTELSQAVNVDIDPSGRPSRRRGRTQQFDLSAAYSFSHGETCLFVSGSTLYQMNSDYSLSEIRSDLTEGKRMKYAAIADRIYYSNGAEKGYILKGKDYTWEKGNYSPPGDTPRILSNPPNGHLLGWFAGRALIAKDNAIFASEPSFYGVFDLTNNYKLMPERVTMLQPTTQGLWVGTTSQVLFYRGTKWRELRREPKAPFGVLEGSDAICAGDKLNLPNQAVLFTTPQGICRGGEDGTFVNLTHNKLTFPSGRYASAAVIGNRYLVLINP